MVKNGTDIRMVFSAPASSPGDKSLCALTSEMLTSSRMRMEAIRFCMTQNLKNDKYINFN
jgi:hypothetical protein